MRISDSDTKRGGTSLRLPRSPVCGDRLAKRLPSLPRLPDWQSGTPTPPGRYLRPAAPTAAATAGELERKNCRRDVRVEAEFSWRSCARRTSAFPGLVLLLKSIGKNDVLSLARLQRHRTRVAAFNGLFRVWPSGQAASSGCLAMAIISTFQLFTIVRVGCCALCIACTAKHVEKAALPKPLRQG